MGGLAAEFKRPERFFRKRGAKALPEHASLNLNLPSGFDSPAQFRRAVGDALADRELSAAAGLTAPGRGVLGLQRILAQAPLGTPPRPEPRRGLNPRVASRDPGTRIQALRRLVEFLLDYRRALAAWRAGAARVVFPAGTYLMRVRHRAVCNAPG
jgi:hypothetical protein